MPGAASPPAPPQVCGRCCDLLLSTKGFFETHRGMALGPIALGYAAGTPSVCNPHSLVHSTTKYCPHGSSAPSLGAPEMLPSRCFASGFCLPLCPAVLPSLSVSCLLSLFPRSDFLPFLDGLPLHQGPCPALGLGEGTASGTRNEGTASGTVESAECATPPSHAPAVQWEYLRSFDASPAWTRETGKCAAGARGADVGQDRAHAAEVPDGAGASAGASAWVSTADAAGTAREADAAGAPPDSTGSPPDGTGVPEAVGEPEAAGTEEGPGRGLQPRGKGGTVRYTEEQLEALALAQGALKALFLGGVLGRATGLGQLLEEARRASRVPLHLTPIRNQAAYSLCVHQVRTIMGGAVSQQKGNQHSQSRRRSHSQRRGEIYVNPSASSRGDLA